LRLQLEVLVQREQGVEDHVAVVARDVRRGPDRIEDLEVGVGHEAQRAALLLRVHVRRGGGGGGERGGAREERAAAERHGWPPLSATARGWWHAAVRRASGRDSPLAPPLLVLAGREGRAMQTVAGTFATRADAERAAAQLEAVGVS